MTRTVNINEVYLIIQSSNIKTFQFTFVTIITENKRIISIANHYCESNITFPTFLLLHPTHSAGTGHKGEMELTSLKMIFETR